MATKNQNLDEIVEKMRAARREFPRECPSKVSTVLGPQSTFAEYERTRSPYNEEVRKMREDYQKAEQALEERAKQMLKSIKSGKILKYSPKELNATMDALNFLEGRNYLELTGGTPKSGVQYKITEKGKAYLKE